MWQSERKIWPADDEQVIGFRDDEVMFWTRTSDGWYVSEKRGSVGHRDRRGPEYWTHIPIKH